MSYSSEYGAVAARWYDGSYDHIRATADIEFYRALARDTGGPVLELGCGTGRVLLPIARDGLACVGLDGSQAMLEVLQRKEPPPSLRLVRAPMEDFDLDGERFALIFSAFRAFQHLITVDDQLRCLANVRRHLAPGGLFAMDVYAPRLDRTALVDEPEADDAHFTMDGTEVTRWVSITRDLATQVQTVRMRYERTRGGMHVGPDDVETFHMRWTHRYELEHLLVRAGLMPVAFYGAFDERPYDYVSGDIVVVARAAM
jgi:SAM-dependent methyltransferase